MSESFKVAVVGAGPSGLSCAAHAAELGVSHVLLEAEQHPSHTIYQYQKGKHVMAEPGVLPLRSPMSFAAGKRENILARWDEEIRKHKVNLRLGTRVTSISGAQGAFTLKTGSGEEFAAQNVVLCIGTQGNLRKLGVPGQDLERVQYQLDDPEAYSAEVIVVVGAGDAAIENAIALSEQNRVIIINRNDEFARCKQGNLDLVLAAIRDGKLECRYGTKPVEVAAVDTEGRPLAVVLQTPTGDETIGCDRVIARLGATPQRQLVESFGIEFASEDPSASPKITDRYESNVPGLYVIGMLAGQPLIKPCMNQGYEVVEHVCGNPVKPADEPLLEEKFRDYKRAASVSEALARVQRNIPLFSQLTTLQLREVILESTIHAPQPDAVIFEKDDYTDSFFSILEGFVQVNLLAKKDEKSRFTLLPRGAFFGEMGLLSGRRRSATVIAGKQCVLIETPRRAMLKLIASADAVRREIDMASLKRVIRTSIAPWVADADLEQMADHSELKSFRAGETIIREGDAPDGLYIIRRGSVVVSKMIGGREIVLNYIPAGRYFGEMALLSDAARNASVKAAVATDTIMLQASTFKEVSERNATMRAGIQTEALTRIADHEQRSNASEDGNLISFLMQQGVGESTDVLLIDESLCIRCDNCERACSDTHDGTSRLERESGPTFANIHVPTSCRHCENPQCMKDCPPDAIHRNPNGEVYIEDSCIGCGNCQRNCPYGVIQMGPASKFRLRPSLWSWLLLGLGTEPGREVKIAGKDQIKKAVKCDMCKDLSGGPACVRACPTGAALRVSPEQFLEKVSGV
jgi:CRP-like cAMP-binding protein/Fe-S-cluster-containing hydrogenase component 2/thioredoxin reductase